MRSIGQTLSRMTRTGMVAFIFSLFLLTLFSVPARAALQAVGPTDPLTGFPIWYQDGSGIAVQECLDLPSATGGIPYCTLLADATFNPLLPISGLPTFTNYPSEMFYWVADNKFNTVPGVAGAIAAVRVAMEATFALGTPQPNQQITFLIVNLQKMSGLTPNSTYTVTHPFGSFTFSTDALGNTVKALAGQAFRVTDSSTPIPLSFADLLPATGTKIGPLLRPSATPGGAPTPPILDPVSGNTYLANPLIATAVTGGTNGNVVTITGPNIGGTGVNSVTSSLWNIQAKQFLGQIPSALTIDRASYARNATTGQIDLFATALPTALLTVTGTGLTTGSMTQDALNPGKFFTSLPFGAALPTGVTINNSLDVPPLPHLVSLRDEVIISQAYYNPVARTVTIKADSRDNATPLPVLSVPQFAAPNTLDATGTLVFPVPLNSIPPATVTVISSHGGSDSSPVSVFTPPAAPLAVNDTASTPFNTAVTIDVLLNDTTLAALDPASVAIVAGSLNGTATVNLNGSIRFTPTAGFSGTTSFTYDVKDIYGQLSNTATVTVTVAPGTAPAPVAVADSATTAAGTAVTISVLANDTIGAPGVINPASVLIATQSLNGIAAANPTGTITFTPAAGFSGITTFTYTVANSSVPPLTSNAATVTVTVSAPPPAPVAVNDSATTTAGTATIIAVLANDTIAAPGVINPASVKIVTQSLNGIAAANLNGTVTFTPTAGFTGITTFTYTVANSSVPPLTSNAATVTVTVTAVPAPVAVNDTATTTAGTAATISVLANDTIAAPGIINPASVLIATQSLNGTAVANLNGTVTFTPAAGFTGITTFTYTVANSSTPPLTSNAATVTVTVNAVAPAPVAVNDTATTSAGAAVTISVLANDTIAAPGIINPASVKIATQSLNGIAAANLNGTITFTPAAGFTGITTFTYTVANSSTPPLTSNAATVTVTVNAAAPAPVAVNDTATTTAGTAVTINVLANDTIAAPGAINPASVKIATQSLNGTAVANATGTITFTPAAGFTGSTTFTYTVANSSVPPLTSNAATVTVTVGQTITVTRAEFTVSTSSWRIDGSISPVPPAGTTLTFYNNPTVGLAPLVTTIPVATNGSFTWTSANGFTALNAQNLMSIQSNQNAATLKQNIAVTRK